MSFSHVRIQLKLASNHGDDTREAFYYPSSDIGSINPYTGAALTGFTWAQKRRTILSPNWRIVSCSITPAYLPAEVPVARAGLRFRIPNGQGIYPGSMDQPNVVQLLTLRSAAGHTREYAMHGFPDNSTTYDPASGLENIGAGPELVAYAAYLIGGTPFQLKVLKQGPRDPLALPIIDITVTAGVVTVRVPALTGITPGTKVYLNALKGYKVQQFAGAWRVKTIDPLALTFALQSSRYVDPNFFLEAGAGTVRVTSDALVGYDSIAAADVGGNHAGTHKVGNSAEGVRGRQSRRR